MNEKKLIESHRELEVYKVAFNVAMRIFQLSKQFPLEERFSLTDQIRRSSRSVCANLSEAWRKRRYEGAFIAKLSDSEAEAAETQTWIEFAVKCNYLDVEVGRELYRAYDQILGMLVNMINKPSPWLILTPKKAISSPAPLLPLPAPPPPAQMRILFTIAHFFNPSGEGKHASQRSDPMPRLSALTACLTALQGLYGKSQSMIHIGQCATVSVNESQVHDIDIVVCTTQDYHLLSHLSLPPKFFLHNATKSEPLMLGFECQAVMRACLEKYDYYCYLEDDLILHDPWLFVKLNWFTRHAGSENLLQANRYEISPQGLVRKAYIDGDLVPQVTARFRNVQEQPQFVGQVMEQQVAFHRALNPHSGCYFLNAQQMAYWANQPYFLDGDTSFIGPLESAATLGIMRSFRIYKPAPFNANFLEIQHFGANFLNLIGNKVSHSQPG